MKAHAWTIILAKITIKLPQEYYVQELELKYISVNNNIEYLQ